MKKKIFISIFIIVLLFFSFLFIKKRKIDINNPPSKYILSTEAEQKKYVDYIKQFIFPEKLRNFLNISNISFSIIREYNSGTEAINWFKYEAYTELFYQMFNKSRNGYEDCPVTENFKNKFKKNLFKHFNFIDVNDSSIDCGISDVDKTIKVTEAGDFNVGEPAYIYYHHFHYILDDEGNVEDIIFDYTE